jgi:hypothetical protein
MGFLRFAAMSALLLMPGEHHILAQKHISTAPINPKTTVEQIRAEVREINSAVESGRSDLRRRSRELPSWQFTGYFQNQHPILLNALFTQGNVASEETYYLHDEKAILLKFSRWWDVDEPREAREATINQSFYIAENKIIRHSIEVDSRPPSRRVIENAESASGLQDRVNLIRQILEQNSADSAITAPLGKFPETELPEE